jgi:hypothetical protein
MHLLYPSLYSHARAVVGLIDSRIPLASFGATTLAVAGNKYHSTSHRNAFN